MSDSSSASHGEKALPGDEPVSRRDFFGALLGKMRNTLADLTDVWAESVLNRASANKRFLRPPGALNELEFMTTCTRCGDCISACHQMSILKADESYGVAIGTPVIDPAKRPCFLCDDLPCIPVCEPKALAMLPRVEVDMGTAVIDYSTCVTSQGESCSYCFDYCPLQGSAIVMENKAPRIIEEHCVGCGMCEYYCAKFATPSITTHPRRQGDLEKLLLPGDKQ